MIKHIDIKILAWYYALRTKELKKLNGSSQKNY